MALPEQKVIDAMDAIVQLKLDFCPTCKQPLPQSPPEPLRCSHCGEEISEDEVFIHNDNGKFCADSTCVQAAFRTLL